MAEEAADEGIDMRLLGGLFDAPAYVRRARNVEQALQHLIARAMAVREEWLGMARLRLGVLRALAGEWSVLRPWLADDEQLRVLESLHEQLSPKLRLPPEPTRSPRKLRRALAELVESLRRFNARWADYLGKIDVAVVNELREGYNRYYLLEKACAVRNEAVVRAGFAPLPPLDLAELRRHLPELPVPQMTKVTR
jgi:hypothetical protein